MTRNAFVCLIVTLLLSANAIHAQKPETMTIKVFFQNGKLNPNQDDCRKVFPTPRTISKTTAVARAALDELFKGATDEERAKTFWSFPPEDTAGIVKGIRVKNGGAYLNFTKVVYEKLGNATSSCGGGFFSSIEATLKQFPTIKNVYYAIEGDTNEFYEWVQVGECPHGTKHCSKANFQ